MTLKSFLVLDSSLSGMDTGASVCIGGTEGHHGARVMRLRAGESILLTDESGHQAEAHVTAVAKAEFTAALTEEPRRHDPRVPTLTLIQALAKGGRDESAIEFATELGVDRVIPWQAERSVVQWRGDRASKGHAKWQATVHAAVKQSRRALIPEVGTVITSPELTRLIGDGKADGGRTIVLHEDGQRGFSEALPALVTSHNGDDAPRDIAVIVGPEGGISDAELHSFVSSGAHAVRLGTEILRASSAGPAALSALCAALGRWS